MVTHRPTSMTPLKRSGGDDARAISKIVLYSMISAILLVLIVIVILVACLCKRRKDNEAKKKKDPSSLGLSSLSDDEPLCCKSKKKKEHLRSGSSLPDVGASADPLPSPPVYEPGTNIGGVYERISTADIDLKYNVVFTNTPDDKLEEKLDTYVSIGRSNSFNPKRRERPVVKRSRDDNVDCPMTEEPSANDTSIKCIETGIVPMETEDIQVRVRDIAGINPEPPRVKQKRTSSKSKSNNKTHNNNDNNIHNNSLTHELIKITPPVLKKDLNKLPRNTEHRSKPPSVSGASIVSSNESEVVSNVGTDSGYEDINSESSPTARRHHRDTDDNMNGDNLKSRVDSPVTSGRRNYVDVDVIPLPCSRLLQQRCDSINERRNSENPAGDDISTDPTQKSSETETNGSVYTQVTIDS